MDRRDGLKLISLSSWFIGGVLIASPASAQQPSEINAVKVSNQAFYVALSSHDMNAMKKVWGSNPDTTNIGPGSKAVQIGWDAIGKGFGRTWEASPDLKVTIEEPQIRIAGATAWATGIEHTERKNKDGAIVRGDNLVTNIFQKQDGRWVMVHHHASRMPQ